MLKSLCLILSLILTPGMASAATQSASAKLLMAPVSGIPLSVTEVEEHSRKLDDGKFAVEYTITAHQYRDPTGRLRIDWETKDEVGNTSGLMVSIIDPVAGVQLFLLGPEKVAYRLQVKVSGEAKLNFPDAADGQDSPHKWKVTHAGAEDRTIEGYKFTGTKTDTSAEDAAGLTTTILQWYSEKLKLIGEIERSGPYKAYTVKVQQLQSGEPDSKLFELPSDYRIIDVAPGPGLSGSESLSLAFP